MLVVIDTPRAGGYYGGTVAGPVFKRIAEAAIRHLGLPRSIDPEAPVFVQKRGTDGVTNVVFGRSSVLPPDPAAGKDGVMPDLRGLSARAAVRVLSRAGFTPHVAGDGCRHDAGPDRRRADRAGILRAAVARPRSAAATGRTVDRAMTIGALVQALIVEGLLPAAAGRPSRTRRPC